VYEQHGAGVPVPQVPLRGRGNQVGEALRYLVGCFGRLEVVDGSPPAFEAFELADAVGDRALLLGNAGERIECGGGVAGAGRVGFDREDR
jgi:hypothetical protein